MCTIERVPIEEELQKLTTEDVFTAEITAKQTSEILHFAAKHLPKLEGIEHIARSPVPVKPPYTKEQFDEWKLIWPVSFRPLTKLRIELEDEDRRFIVKCLEEIKDEKMVVMAKHSEVIARARDGTAGGHPLKHAAMCCIALVADMEVERRRAGVLVPLKRPASPLPQDAEEREKSPQAMGYLCEGMDVFSTKEPCVMCCMALVHSRIGRLFFLEESKSGGISYYSMHSLKALNHHFIAYKCSM
ncbi:cytidine deaminase-like protein [Kickxella alabastrina]|uniref:cytidine deaminase-like protein n=1 Tax=Kickxella alabastrina TaxID=61397 RepID=UPI00221E638E|nr:cytidine deaminase-like protein [Kickxella alabastrina]KAI7832918.1 cytidine deaminase-like protein [Kickxella alabastrina]KAJ1946099.1 tRNA-specific adenosine deaminase subunit tad3 [Kickxella alabastrina]